MSEIKEFKIRCSAIGKIMGVRGLGKTGQSFCEDWLKEQIYGRRKEFSSKHTQKGLDVEDAAIDFIAEHLEYGFLMKNEEYFNNDFLTGTPDVIIPEVVIDVKSSWDCFTFPYFAKDIPNKDYFYQLQGYMALTGRRKAKLIYCLMDTPENIIFNEAKSFCYKNGIDDLDTDTYKAIHDRMTYGGIPEHQKIKVFDIDYDQKVVDAIEARVSECRNYINELFK